MRKILFPTDFSEAALRAFIYALRFADRFNAELVLLHVYDLPTPKGTRVHTTLDEIHKEMVAEKLEHYQESLAKLKEVSKEQELEHINITNILKKDSSTVTSILRVAAREEVDMIIMGTKGASGAKEIFIGSVAGEIMENASVPVLAVPEDAIFDNNITKIGLTTEFSEEEVKVFDRVLKFAKIFVAEIYAINVDINHVEFYRQMKPKWEAKYADHPEIHFEVIEGDNLLEPVSDFVHEKGIDLLAMLTHKRNFLQELFHYSSAKRLSYRSDIPILAIQAHTLKDK